MDPRMFDVEGAKSNTDISSLPEEMLRRILKLLPHKDLMCAMLVCKSWEMIGQDPALWTFLVVKVNNKQDIKKLEIPRLKKIQAISLCSSCDGFYDQFASYHEHSCDLQEPDGLRDLFQAILAIPSITEIDGIFTYDLTSLEPRLYTSIMARLKSLYFGRELTEEQFENIFASIAEEGSNAEKIDIDFSGYGFRPDSNFKVSPHLFASAVTNVREVSMFAPMDYEGERIQAMFKMIRDNNRCLKRVSICMGYHNHLANLEPEDLGTALNRLEDVLLGGLSPVMGGDWGRLELLTDIFKKLVRVDSKLKRLKLRFLNTGDIDEVNPELVNQAVEKVGQLW